MISAGFAGSATEKSYVSNALCASRHVIACALGSIAVSLRATTNKGAKIMSHTTCNIPVSLKLIIASSSVPFATLPT